VPLLIIKDFYPPFISDGDEATRTFDDLHAAWNKHPFKGLHTHYRGFPGKVPDVGIEGASNTLQVEITNATRQVNPMII
jgi:hypothetical protein